MSIKRKLISISLSLTLIIAMAIPTFASAEALPEAVNGEDVADEVVEEIVEDGDFTRSEEAEIEEDVEALDELGLPVELIEDVNVENEEMVYFLEYSDGIVDEITVNTTSDGTIIMNSKEGQKEDELIVEEDGTMFLDGEEILYDMEICDSSSEDGLTTSTGGIKWCSRSKATKAQKDATYNTLKQNWVCSSVNLQKSLNTITYSTFISAMGGIKGGPLGAAAGAAAGFVLSSFYELVNSKPNSKTFSYKTYVGRAKKNNRYLKQKTVTYPARNFSGTGVVTYSYGLVI